MNKNTIDTFLEGIKNNNNATSTFIECCDGLTTPSMVRYSDDRTNVVLCDENEVCHDVINIRQVEAHDMTNMIKEFPRYSYAFVDDKRDVENATGMTMLLLFEDINYETRTFTLRGKRVPHEAVVPGNTHFENNDSYSLFFNKDIAQWTGIVGNGLIEFLVDAHFDSCGVLTVHSSARLSQKKTPFFMPFTYIE